jgi:hypothetical protein
MFDPSELTQPFENDVERQTAIVELLQLDEQLQHLLDASKKLATTGSIPDDVRSKISGQPMLRGDTPEGRLRRWTSLFEDDLDKVHDVRSRVIHGILVPDADVKGAVWLGGHVLGLLAGGSPAAVG